MSATPSGRAETAAAVDRDGRCDTAAAADAQECETSSACETCTLACSMAGAAGPTAEERVALVAGGATAAVLAVAPLTVPSSRLWWLVVLAAVSLAAGVVGAGLGVDALRHGGDRAARSFARGSRILPLALAGTVTVWAISLVALVVSLW